MKSKSMLSLSIFIPIFAFVALFAIYPAIGMVIGSFSNGSHATLANYKSALQGQYLSAFATTSLLSLEGALIGIVGGGLVTWALTRSRLTWLQSTLTAVSSVMANFAGLPLAVAFMATLGTSGFVTIVFEFLFGKNLTDLGFNLASATGLMIVYATFLVPLAVILLLPAVHSIRSEWEEAVYTLGGSIWRYIRAVVLPILTPSLVGTFALLFANAFSSYVTAYAIAGGSINLIPIQIGYLIDGNVTMNLGLGDALAMLEMVVLGLAVVVFLAMQRIAGPNKRGGEGRA
ncbi:ABC transporter permease [Alicyclobacillus acidiphilus]|uniref:ABC transporter permease n=1 Tax=Alicyclobacillus acidiphilus TaxID=182455 RepID=UPI00082CF3B7|nr:hypothetical protein [Alicyclobacillus acidiphilus]